MGPETIVSTIAALAAIAAALIAVVQARSAAVQAQESRRAADLAEAQLRLTSDVNSEQRQSEAYAAARAVLDAAHLCVDAYRMHLEGTDDSREADVHAVRRARLDLFKTYRNSLPLIRRLPLFDRLSGYIREIEYVSTYPVGLTDSQVRSLRKEANKIGAELTGWLLKAD